MPDDLILTATFLEDACFSLDELAQASAVSREWISLRIDAGLLVEAAGVAAPRFSARDRLRVRRMHALERDFDADPALAALAVDLMEEIDRLRARLRRAGLDPMD
jgi:chaperone modulatory protein CbpM